jgi:rhomboid protease GluP
VDEDDTSGAGVEVFRGSRAACFEYGLVLDAKGLGYERVEAEGTCLLLVAPALREVAADELRRYAAERSERREAPTQFVSHPGGGAAAAVYAFVLILVAYCAGAGAFGSDWLAAGAIESDAGIREWWRPVTALTLHLDQEHLLGNLLFGIGIGTLAARTFGPGVAWLSILVSGAFGNAIDMLVSPAGHRAVGASTAVFAALGLLAGFGWGQTPVLRERRLYRWAPLFGGACLLVFLGSGASDRHVDVLGHLLGFAAGIALGAAFAGSGLPRHRGGLAQGFAAAAALSLVAVAWCAALAAAR